MVNIQTIKVRTPLIVRRWSQAVVAAGGGFEANSLSIASRLVQVLQGKPYYSKLRYLLPMLGSGIGAARVPLIDTIGAGTASNGGFVDADFSQATGLQGNGTSKSFNLNIQPNDTSTGIGYWENNINFGGSDSSPMGCGVNTPSDRRWFFDLRPALRIFSWGQYANRATVASGAANGLFYGQSSAANSRILYFNGSQIATNTTSDGVTSTSVTMRLLGWFYAGTEYYWAGRCAAAFVTNGQMTVDEINDFQSTLQSYLLTPTGRPGS